MISDGIMPSNEGRGYVLRRIIRRAARHGRMLGIDGIFMAELAKTVISESKDGYPELEEKKDFILKVLAQEEEKFAKTIDQGLAILEEMEKESGNVVVGDDVEIGCNTCIDRATVDSTVIGKGTKIDNLVHVGHNDVIGENCILVAHVGISGSVTVGHNTTFGGQAATAGHLKIGSNCTFAGRTGIISDVPDNVVWAGFPAQSHVDWLRMMAIQDSDDHSAQKADPYVSGHSRKHNAAQGRTEHHAFQGHVHHSGLLTDNCCHARKDQGS